MVRLIFRCYFNLKLFLGDAKLPSHSIHLRENIQSKNQFIILKNFKKWKIKAFLLCRWNFILSVLPEKWKITLFSKIKILKRFFCKNCYHVFHMQESCYNIYNCGLTKFPFNYFEKYSLPFRDFCKNGKSGSAILFHNFTPGHLVLTAFGWLKWLKQQKKFTHELITNPDVL